MAKLGSKKRPIIARVQTEKKAKYVADICEKNGWQFILGIEPGKPENLTDLEKLLNPPQVIKSIRIGRNDPCSCGSGKKYKKCCGTN